MLPNPPFADDLVSYADEALNGKFWLHSFEVL